MSEERAHPISIEFAKQLEDAIFTGKVNLEEAGLIVAVDIADILDEILIVELPKLLSAQLATIAKAVEKVFIDLETREDEEGDSWILVPASELENRVAKAIEEAGK